MRNLGRNMPVTEVMSSITPDCWLRPEDSILDSIERFHRFRLDALPVVDGEGALIGILTKWALYRCLISRVSPEEKIDGYYIRDVIFVRSHQVLDDDILENIKNSPVGQRVVVDEKGRPVGMLTKINIVFFLLYSTETLMTELAAVLNAIPIGVIAVDNRGLVKLINPAAESLLDRPRESVAGQPLAGTFRQFNLDGVLADGKVRLWEKCRLDSRTVIYSGHPIRCNDRISGAIGIVQDLTEFENISQELESVKRLKQTLETILASIDSGIVVTDEKGVVVRVNQAARALLRKSQEEVVGREFKEVFGSRVVDMVLYKGISEVDVGSLGGQSFLMTSNPVLESGSVVGTVTNLIFRNLIKLKYLMSRLDLLENQLNHYKKELIKATASRYSFDSIITRSRAMTRLKKEAMAAASGFSNILLLGESGTGKELFAHAIHDASPRRMSPFVKVNCAAIPENLLESELFGYEDGAFTGAKKGGKPGKFELAHGGTIFLDEIGDMPLPLQAKILRVLQDREVERVGGTGTIQVDVRIIAATNMNITEMVNKNKFRKDLYYRLNVISLQIPPLRERREDVMFIAEHYLKHFNQVMGTEVRGFSRESVMILENHDWPGNVRELANMVERAVNMNSGGLIRPEHLPPYLVERNVKPEPVLEQEEEVDYRKKLKDYEKSLMLAALQDAGGRFSKAAEMLGMSRSRFYEKMAAYNIKVPPGEGKALKRQG